jgi:hypothetical protein
MSSWALIFGIVAFSILVFRWHIRRWRKIREREFFIDAFTQLGFSKEQLQKVLDGGLSKEQIEEVLKARHPTN